MIGFLRPALLGFVLSGGIAVLSFPSAASAAEYTPRSGQPGKDVVWVPSPPEMVEKLLDLAGVTAEDFVIDLGSGDGRTVIGAAKRGARAHGIEYDADLVELSRRNARKAGVRQRATFERGDVFESDFSRATVIVLFLTPEMNIRLRPRLLELKPGTRIVANTFGLGDWNADKTATLPGDCARWCFARLWIVPAKVGGRWTIGGDAMRLAQRYQTFSGALEKPDGAAAIAGRLRGDEIFFGTGKTHFTGRVAGGVMKGFARTDGRDAPFRATRVAD